MFSSLENLRAMRAHVQLSAATTLFRMGLLMTYLEPREDDTTDIFILYFFSFVREADLEILMLFVCVSVHSNVENMSD